MSDQGHSLFTGFKESSREEWAAQVRKTLKNGESLEKLDWLLEDELILKPYYDRSDVGSLGTLAFQNQLLNDPSRPRYWENLQKIDVKDFSATNQQAREVLLQTDGIIFNGRLIEAINFDQLLSGIDLNHYNISFDIPENQFIDHLKGYCTFIRKKGVVKKDIRGSFNGGSGQQAPEALRSSSDIPYLRVIDLRSQEETCTDQIADLLAQAVGIFNMLASEFDIRSIAHKMTFSVSVWGDYFAEIAKIRALRMLFFQVCCAYGTRSCRPGDIHIHAVSPGWVDENYEPNANLLKGTTAAMAAILGGCNSLYVAPENDANPLLVRLARNISIILREESFFEKTADPVAGSYYLEALTDKMAKKAWKKFQQRVKENEK